MCKRKVRDEDGFTLLRPPPHPILHVEPKYAAGTGEEKRPPASKLSGENQLCKCFMRKEIYPKDTYSGRGAHRCQYTMINYTAGLLSKLWMIIWCHRQLMWLWSFCPRQKQCYTSVALNTTHASTKGQLSPLGHPCAQRYLRIRIQTEAPVRISDSHVGATVVNSSSETRPQDKRI